MAIPNAAFPPPPEDLTDSIVKLEAQHSEAGYFGDVHKCLYNGRMVAVKAFRFKFRVDSEGMARRELGIWRRLDHPNIVPFLGIATGFGVSGSTSLVSLWMCNGTLESFLQKYENLEVGHRLRLVLDVASGLHHLHSFTLPTGSSDSTNPILHGDLNPANVLLDDDYTARLVDFGYASMAGEIPEALIYLRRSTHRPGALRWNAPEQVSSNSGSVCRTAEIDVYSFGCIALQVLSGQQPWSEIGEDVAVILRLSKGEMPGRPGSRPIADQHWGLIERCLSPAPNRPAMDTIVSSIERFMESFPPFKHLRDAITSPSCQNAQHPDPGDSSSSTLVAGPDRRDQHVAVA